VALGTVVRRFPPLQLATEAVQWRANFGFRGLIELPVTWQTLASVSLPPADGEASSGAAE
jgi:hypothetical protein